MDEHDWLAQRFEEHQTHLGAVAYRMLGSLSEADDAVQGDNLSSVLLYSDSVRCTLQSKYS